jgi:hypothetical protein
VLSPGRRTASGSAASCSSTACDDMSPAARRARSPPWPRALSVRLLRSVQSSDESRTRPRTECFGVRNGDLTGASPFQLPVASRRGALIAIHHYRDVFMRTSRRPGRRRRAENRIHGSGTIGISRGDEFRQSSLLPAPGPSAEEGGRRRRHRSRGSEL